MSISEIKFTIKEYNPLSFNFSNCYFQIYSDDTKFEKCIYYPQNNSVMDKTELKNNLKYFVKAMTEGEIFGIASFIIPRKIFDKKLKLYNFNNIELTLSEAILNPIKNGEKLVEMNIFKFLLYKNQNLRFQYLYK